MIENTFFYIGQKLILPDLAKKLDLDNSQFIVEEVFQGGMGTCVKILDSTNNYYAIKVIHTSLLSNEKALQRYIEEMKTWLTLSSCNGVVEAIVFTRVNDIPCVVAQWMQGGDLTPYIGKRDPIMFYKTFDRIIATLEWAYSKYSIIHRDLKPGNILMDEHGNAFIGDWGLARPISKKASDDKSVSLDNVRIELTEAGSFLGTIVYASPEQIQGLPNIDHRSDIYTLGCMMYEWETGNLPFYGKTAQEIATKHLCSKAPKLGGFFSKTNFGVERIIAKCMEKDPAKRYQTYGELHNAFLDIASKHKDFEPFSISERYKIPIIGGNTFAHEKSLLRQKGVVSKDGKYIIVEESELMPYYKEAIALMDIYKYEEAKTIWKSLYIPETVRSCADLIFIQSLVINYAECLSHIGNIDAAINVLLSISSADRKPAEYYVNLSQYNLVRRNYLVAEEVCKEGLSIYPDDIDIMGNLTIALTQQDRLQEAFDSAYKRISISRDVHSLEEAASVVYHIAESEKCTNFPQAIENYRKALGLLYEARKLNPNFYSVRCSIANILLKLKKYTESVEEAAIVAKECKNETMIKNSIYTIARCLYWCASEKSCIDFCDKWLKSFPNDTGLLQVKYQVMLQQYHQSNDSIVSFFEKLVIDSKNRIDKDFDLLAQAYILRYTLYGNEDDIDRAYDTVNKGIESNPTYWIYFFRLSGIYRGINMLQKALESALKAQQLAPWREYTYRQVSSIYQALGETSKASFYEKEFNRIKSIKDTIYKGIKL